MLKQNAGPTETDTENELIKRRLSQVELELAQSKEALTLEKDGKRKLYSSLVKVAHELTRTKAEASAYATEAEYANKRWYDGGMWRTPELLPGLTDIETGDSKNTRSARDAVSLTDLFLDLVIVIAFSRVGTAVQDRGTVDGPVLAYFAIFWQIWSKEASYSTRFDTTDLSSQIEVLLTCFAVLFGSLSSTETFASVHATRIMMVADFVAMLHFLLHLRISLLYGRGEGSDLPIVKQVKNYAKFIMLMTFAEALVWTLGILFMRTENPYRWVVFLLGILMSTRVPKSFLSNDFHGARSKRGVLFILLLGFMLQSLVLAATPFFDYQTPSSQQYIYFACGCFLLFCIKLLYVDDNQNVDPEDHALLVNRFAGFFFYIGQFCLLLSTTVLGAGLSLLTHSFLAATAAMPNNAKNLVCGGFSAVILSITFIKSMHIRRVPLNPLHERIFFLAYCLQLLVTLALAYVTGRMSISEGYFQLFQRNEIEMLIFLSGSAFLLVIISWLDEGVELALYKGDTAREVRVHPFGFWWCLKVKDDSHTIGDLDPPTQRNSRISLMSGSVNKLSYQGLSDAGNRYSFAGES